MTEEEEEKGDGKVEKKKKKTGKNGPRKRKNGAESTRQRRAIPLPRGEQTINNIHPDH